MEKTTAGLINIIDVEVRLILVTWIVDPLCVVYKTDSSIKKACPCVGDSGKQLEGREANGRGGGQSPTPPIQIVKWGASVLTSDAFSSGLWQSVDRWRR